MQHQWHEQPGKKHRSQSHRFLVTTAIPHRCGQQGPPCQGTREGGHGDQKGGGFPSPSPHHYPPRVRLPRGLIFVESPCWSPSGVVSSNLTLRLPCSHGVGTYPFSPPITPPVFVAPSCLASLTLTARQQALYWDCLARVAVALPVSPRSILTSHDGI